MAFNFTYSGLLCLSFSSPVVLAEFVDHLSREELFIRFTVKMVVIFTYSGYLCLCFRSPFVLAEFTLGELTDHLSRNELFIRFTVRGFLGLLLTYIYQTISPCGFEG